MKQSLPVCLIASALLLVPALQATVLVHEPFDYTVGENIGVSAATGTGLTGSWQRTFTDTASAILRTNAVTWNTPTGYGYSPINKGVGTPVDQNNSAAVNLASAAQIDFGTDGVFYYSYLLKYGTDNRSRVSFGSSGSPDLVRLQGIANGTLRVYVGGDFAEGGALAADTDHLVIGRISVESGTAEHRVWVYPSSGTVAGSDPGATGSYAGQSGAVSGTADMLQFSNVIDAQYGEFRMGTSWESVTIPEPGAYAMIAGLAGLALVALRRPGRG